MKAALISVVILSLIIGLTVFFSKSSPKDSISFGMMSGWAPFMVINAQGEFEGFDVDVAKEIAKRLGKKSEITDMGALASLFMALDRNKIDMILSGLDITKERQEKLSMIAYCGDNTKEYNLLFYKNIPADINTIEDLKNYANPTVVVEPGVSAEKYLATLDFITTKQISSLVDRLLDLQYGKSLAMLIEPHVAQNLIAKNPHLKALRVPLPEEFQIHGMGIALRKDNQPLSHTIKNIIQAMKDDGTLKKLEQKWQLQIPEA